MKSHKRGKMRYMPAGAARDRAVREIIGRAISHDLRSPMMHFQDDLADALERQEKLRGGGVIDRARLSARLERFNDSLEKAYVEFRVIADEVRAPEAQFSLIYAELKRRVRPIVEGLIHEMQLIIADAESQKLLSDPKLKRDVTRFRINVERLYFALETISYTGSDLAPEPVNLPVNLRRLYLAAASRDSDFNFGHVSTSYVARVGLRSSTLSTIEAYRHQIVSALQNVLLNALRYAAESKEREIFYCLEHGRYQEVMSPYVDRINRYNPSGEWIVFHILNSGTRIRENVQDNLFGYGTTYGSNAHERYGGGSGVGLAVAKLMVTDNGGLIFYNPSNPFHTDFCIALPVKSKDRIPEATLFAKEYSRQRSD